MFVLWKKCGLLSYTLNDIKKLYFKGFVCTLTVQRLWTKTWGLFWGEELATALQIYCLSVNFLPASLLTKCSLGSYFPTIGNKSKFS